MMTSAHLSSLMYLQTDLDIDRHITADRQTDRHLSLHVSELCCVPLGSETHISESEVGVLSEFRVSHLEI